MLDLKNRGLIGDGVECGGTLSYVLDNCGGQNKNRMVLRLALFLVETGKFKCVRFVFLVRGHTKNACDRLFNLLKKTYRASDIYTLNQLHNVLNEADDVEASLVNTNQFKNYDELLDKYYKRLQTGSVNINHIFECKRENPTTLLISRVHGDEQVSQDLGLGLPIGKLRTDVIKTTEAHTLDAPGLAMIKQVDLFKKWRPFIPVQFQDEICPEPSPEVMTQVAKERNQKRRNKKTTVSHGTDHSTSTSTSIRKCGQCGELGHNRSTCTTTNSIQDVDKPKLNNKRKCGLCGAIGHNARSCEYGKGKAVGNQKKDPVTPVKLNVKKDIKLTRTLRSDKKLKLSEGSKQLKRKKPKKSPARRKDDNDSDYEYDGLIYSSM